MNNPFEVHSFAHEREHEQDDPNAALQREIGETLPLGNVPLKSSPMEERYQWWPERMIRSGVMAPYNAMTGAFGQPGSREFTEQALGPANDMSGLMGTGMLRPYPGVGTFGGRLPSAVTRAVENAQQPRATGDQWLGYLRNRPGVTQEELNYMNVPPCLSGLSARNAMQMNGGQNGNH